MSASPTRRQPVRTLTAVGLVIDATVVAADVLTPHFDVPTAPLMVAPLLPAVAGLLAATACLAVITLVIAVAMLAAHETLGNTNELICLVSVAITGALAMTGARLRRQADELARALDSLPDAVTIQGADGTVLYGNRAAAQLTGEPDRVSPGAAAEYLARMVVTGEDGGPLDPERMPAQRLIRGEPAGPVVVKSLDPATGVVRWTRVQASPLHDAEGRVRTAVNVIEDITAVKAAEERAAFLADAGALLGSSLDTTLTLQRTAQLVVPALADWCSIDLLQPGGRTELVAFAHSDTEKIALGHELRRRYPPDLTRSDGLGRVLSSGQPELHAHITPEELALRARDAEHHALLEQIGFSSALMVPLAIGPRVIGAMTWGSSGSRPTYGTADVEAASLLAARAAVAVENARVHSAHGEIATALQEALLPPALPNPPGWELAAHYRAAGEANEVGGDFYDVVALDDGALLALVGDVVGKGAPAAALTARTRHTLVTAAELGGGDACPGLTLLNSTMQAEEGCELCSVVVLRARGSELTIVSAGHPLPLLVRAGELLEPGTTSPMLGVAPLDCSWTITTLPLVAGDLLLLYTDGVTDAVGGAERFGDTRLRAALAEGAAAPQVAIDRIVARVDAFERGLQADDRVLLALRYTG